MPDVVDQEIDAIRNVLAALQPLSEHARTSVLEYVAKRLSIASPTATVSTIQPPDISTAADTQGQDANAIHIKEFKEQKKPRSANEMAAVVAYYLANLVTKSERKTEIDQTDIETYFKIAQFPLPKTVRVTLANARQAGYFELAGNGKYKLNAIGHNLVVHSMPRGSAAPGAKRAAKRKLGKTARNKNAKKRSVSHRKTG